MNEYNTIISLVEKSLQQKNVNKLCKIAALLCSLYTYKDMRGRIGKLMVEMIFNKEFPTVRKESAEKLYMAVLTDDNIALNEVLISTNWTDDIEVIGCMRETVEALLLK